MQNMYLAYFSYEKINRNDLTPALSGGYTGVAGTIVSLNPLETSLLFFSLSGTSGPYFIKVESPVLDICLLYVQIA